MFYLSSTRHSGIHVSVCIHVLPCKIAHHNTNDDENIAVNGVFGNTRKYISGYWNPVTTYVVVAYCW